MKRIVPLALVAVAAIALAVFGYSRLQASDQMDGTAFLAAINEELDGTGWNAEAIEFTGERFEQREGDERLMVQDFTATARAVQPFYRQSERHEDTIFVELSVARGTTFALSGEAILFTAPGMREEVVRLVNHHDMLDSGRPLDRFGGQGTAVHIEGTDEALAARAAIEQARAEAEAAREAENDRINAFYSGEWISRGRCGNIDFEHRFTLEPDDQQGRFTGEVTYRPIYPSPPFEFGSYTANARHDTRNDRLVIDFVRWIEQPQGNRGVSVTLAAEGEDEGGQVELIGESPNLLGAMSGGNCTYRLQRPDAFAAERETVLGPVRALLERIEEGVWIEGSQSGPERDGRTDWPVRVRVVGVTEDYIMAEAELMGFHANSRTVLGEFELRFALFLTDGIDAPRIEFGRRPAIRGRDVRNLYNRGSACPAMRISLDAETGVVTGSNNDRGHCIDELRLPLVP
ncbi:MAG: hypothetical protein JJT95_08365 [Pararhodobacter sp.]|nr:hypothetical protein [Pararhodobacter sp.]